jgi:hypothetical protein
MAAGPLTAVGNPFVCKSDEVIRVLTVAHLVTTPATVILSEVEEPVLSAAAKEPARTTFVRRLTEQDQYLTLHVLQQHPAAAARNKNNASGGGGPAVRGKRKSPSSYWGFFVSFGRMIPQNAGIWPRKVYLLKP